MTVVGNVPSWRNHASGAKENTCAADDATKTDAKNEYGDSIGVACCNAAGTKGSRPGCKKSVPWEDAKQHCESKGLRLCSVAEVEKGLAKGTGCMFDAYLQWTSDSCEASSPSSASSPSAPEVEYILGDDGAN